MWNFGALVWMYQNKDCWQCRKSIFVKYSLKGKLSLIKKDNLRSLSICRHYRMTYKKSVWERVWPISNDSCLPAWVIILLLWWLSMKTTCCLSVFKGTVPRDFLPLVFFLQTVPPGPKRHAQKRFRFFLIIRRDIRLFRCFAVVNDTGNACIAGVVDTGE